MKKVLKECLKLLSIAIILVIVLNFAINKGKKIANAKKYEYKKALDYSGSIEMQKMKIELLENDNVVAESKDIGDEDIEANDGKILTNNITNGERFICNKKYEDKLAIRNSGEIDVYCKVTLNKYWEDEKGKNISDAIHNPNDIQINFANTSDWLENKTVETGERTVLFYKHVLDAGETTPNIIDGFSVNSNDKAEFTNKINEDGTITITSKRRQKEAYMCLGVQVDTVQTHSAGDAMKGDWGVIPEFDENGDIISIKKAD